ncbi:hypothetical protein Tco_1508812 [Tanacetum coccineum]
MAQENYVKWCSMQRPPLLEADKFCSCKTRFETYIKSKNIDIWQVIQNGDFVFMMDDLETKMEVKVPYELLKDDQKKKLGKNNKDKMTCYIALSHKDFTIFNAIITSLKSLDQDYSSIFFLVDGNSSLRLFDLKSKEVASLAVLITGASQSRQHDMSKPARRSLTD